MAIVPCIHCLVGNCCVLEWRATTGVTFVDLCIPIAVTVHEMHAILQF